MGTPRGGGIGKSLKFQVWSAKPEGAGARRFRLQASRFKLDTCLTASLRTIPTMQPLRLVPVQDMNRPKAASDIGSRPRHYGQILRRITRRLSGTPVHPWLDEPRQVASIPFSAIGAVLAARTTCGVIRRSQVSQLHTPDTTSRPAGNSARSYRISPMRFTPQSLKPMYRAHLGEAARVLLNSPNISTRARAHKQRVGRVLPSVSRPQGSATPAAVRNDFFARITLVGVHHFIRRAGDARPARGAWTSCVGRASPHEFFR